ncbi:hypothetical protein AVEN_44719-1 [Araneus ventricosus]|uniref:Uncharacterized protein n=1 Tax=Araneus ventricosus TaxID=182803 RepID=A0A4Y2QK30_ARAVE|nr:hypothetical protein AVEN_44719-1 [Araneus ventricosus]
MQILKKYNKHGFRPLVNLNGKIEDGPWGTFRGIMSIPLPRLYSLKSRNVSNEITLISSNTASCFQARFDEYGDETGISVWYSQSPDLNNTDNFSRYLEATMCAQIKLSGHLS